MRKSVMALVVLLAVLFGASSCSPKVSQEDYDRVNNELSAVQSQISSLQDELAAAMVLKTQNEELTRQYSAMKSDFEELGGKYEELNGIYEELSSQYDTMKGDYDKLQAEYLELSTEYEELSKRYDAIMEEPAEIISEDVEQAIFALINQGRKNNRLDELLWGKYLYKSATTNSLNMAKKQQLEYSKRTTYQEVYRTTGYTSTEELAEAVMTIWENTSLYEYNFLNSVMVYGAVAVHKSGEIFYITFMNDYFQ